MNDKPALENDGPEDGEVVPLKLYHVGQVRFDLQHDNIRVFYAPRNVKKGIFICFKNIHLQGHWLCSKGV